MECLASRVGTRISVRPRLQEYTVGAYALDDRHDIPNTVAATDPIERAISHDLRPTV